MVPQDMFKKSLVCFYKWKCPMEMYEMLEHNIKTEKEKRDFVFYQLKLAWPNDEDVSFLYQLLSFFFVNMNW